MKLVAYDPGRKHNVFVVEHDGHIVDALMLDFPNFSAAYNKVRRLRCLEEADFILVEEQFPCSILEVRDNSTLVRSLYYDKVIMIRPCAWRKKLKRSTGAYSTNKKDSQAQALANPDLITITNAKNISHSDLHHFGDCLGLLEYYKLKQI